MRTTFLLATMLGALGATSETRAWDASPTRAAAIQIDNDALSGAGHDRDYSGGLTVTFAQGEPARLIAPLERARERLASWTGDGDRRAAYVSRAGQLGLIAMTPDDIGRAAPDAGDRPYASLVFATSAQTEVLETAGRARFTSFTVGVLGLDLAGRLQEELHEAIGAETPRGWAHQISAGGEPTARFVRAEQWLLGAEREGAGSREVKLTLSGSAGFLTEASAALSMRFGALRTPWWSFNPELGDYAAPAVAPAAALRFADSPETFAFAGVRLKARAYNAFLQGQWRESEVRVASSDLARLQGEAWAGVASNWKDWRLSYSVHLATREVTSEPASRTLLWARLGIERSF